MRCKNGFEPPVEELLTALCEDYALDIFVALLASAVEMYTLLREITYYDCLEAAVGLLLLT